MDDQLDVPLEDTELLAEVELTADLMIAASRAEEPLSQGEVDRLLGVEGAPAAGAAPTVPEQPGGPAGDTPG